MKTLYIILIVLAVSHHFAYGDSHGKVSLISGPPYHMVASLSDEGELKLGELKLGEGYTYESALREILKMAREGKLK